MIDRQTVAALTAAAECDTPEDALAAIGRARTELGRHAALFEPLLERLASRARQVEELTRLAGTDPLTGIANRGAFQNALGREVAIHNRTRAGCAVVLLDLDGLKQLNDTHGHKTGDEAILAVARAASDTIRTTDLVARLGGDEFAILLPRANADGAREVADRIRERLERTLVAGQPVRVSVGISATESARATADGLVAVADAELYADKRLRYASFRPSNVRLAPSRLDTEPYEPAAADAE